MGIIDLDNCFKIFSKTNYISFLLIVYYKTSLVLSQDMRYRVIRTSTLNFGGLKSLRKFRLNQLICMTATFLYRCKLTKCFFSGEETIIDRSPFVGGVIEFKRNIFLEQPDICVFSCPFLLINNIFEGF